MKNKSDKGLIVFAVVTLILLVICSMMYYVTKSTAYLAVLMFTPAISVMISKLVCRDRWS